AAEGAAARLPALPQPDVPTRQAGHRRRQRHRLRRRVPAGPDVRPVPGRGARPVRHHRGPLGAGRAVGRAAPLAHPAPGGDGDAPHRRADIGAAGLRGRPGEPRRPGRRTAGGGAGDGGGHRRQRAAVGSGRQGDGLRRRRGRVDGGAGRGRPPLRARLPERGRPGGPPGLPGEAQAELVGPLIALPAFLCRNGAEMERQRGRRPADVPTVRPVAATVVAVGLLAAAALASAAPARASLPGLAAGCTLFPADNAWHADVSRLPVNPRSADWIASMGGPDRRLHPDFGPNDGGGQPYGIPYSVVAGSTSKVAVTFDYADESDPGPYPFGPSTPVEQGSDAHALVVDKDHCTLYELYAADWNGGHPTAGSGAVWDLRSGALRPNGWTSADAAGLPILPGLLRRDEVAAGDVDHAIRITAARTDRRFVWPARHQAGAAADPTLPPMGAWFRLKASFDISHFRPDTQVVLRAMQRHGLIVADNGSNWYFTGTSEPGWDTSLLDELRTIPAGAFEALDTSSLVADPNSGRVASSPPPAPATTAP